MLCEVVLVSLHVAAALSVLLGATSHFLTHPLQYKEVLISSLALAFGLFMILIETIPTKAGRLCQTAFSTLNSYAGRGVCLLVLTLLLYSEFKYLPCPSNSVVYLVASLQPKCNLALEAEATDVGDDYTNQNSQLLLYAAVTWSLAHGLTYLALEASGRRVPLSRSMVPDRNPPRPLSSLTGSTSISGGESDPERQANPKKKTGIPLPKDAFVNEHSHTPSPLPRSTLHAEDSGIPVVKSELQHHEGPSRPPPCNGAPSLRQDSLLTSASSPKSESASQRTYDLAYNADLASGGIMYYPIWSKRLERNRTPSMPAFTPLSPPHFARTRNSSSSIQAQSRRVKSQTLPTSRGSRGRASSIAEHVASPRHVSTPASPLRSCIRGQGETAEVSAKRHSRLVLQLGLDSRIDPSPPKAAEERTLASVPRLSFGSGRPSSDLEPTQSQKREQFLATPSTIKANNSCASDVCSGSDLVRTSEDIRTWRSEVLGDASLQSSDAEELASERVSSELLRSATSAIAFAVPNRARPYSITPRQGLSSSHGFASSELRPQTASSASTRPETGTTYESILSSGQITAGFQLGRQCQGCDRDRCCHSTNSIVSEASFGGQTFGSGGNIDSPPITP